VRNITGGRGVLGGAVLLAVGFAFLLPALGARDATAYLFLFLGIAFAAAYRMGTRPYVYLVPAATLVAFGLGVIVPSTLGLQNPAAAAIFLAALAAGLVVVYLVAPDRRLPLVPAGVLAIVALADLFGGVELVPAGLQSLFVPIIFIALGAYLLIEPRTH
jgi:hypothetical protein